MIIGFIALSLLGGGIFGIASVLNTQEKVLKLGLEDVGELVTQTCHTVVLEDTVMVSPGYAPFKSPELSHA